MAKDEITNCTDTTEVAFEKQIAILEEKKNQAVPGSDEEFVYGLALDTICKMYDEIACKWLPGETKATVDILISSLTEISKEI